MRIRAVGLFNDSQLIKPNATMPIRNRGDQRLRKTRLAVARVDHHEIIAESVHFFEFDILSYSCHERAYNPVKRVIPVSSIFCAFLG